MWIDFGQEFVAWEVQDCARPRFQSVKMDVDVWMGNIWAEPISQPILLTQRDLLVRRAPAHHAIIA